MNAINYDRKMTDAEGLMWRLEADPHLSSTFAAVSMLDTMPDIDQLRHRLERAAQVMPRLRQVVRTVPGNLAPPTWVDDPEFSIDHHIHHVALPAGSSERALLDLASLITVDPFDVSRPLWQFTVIEGLPDDRAALVQKMHHTIADGESGVRLSLEYLDLERHPEPSPGPDTPSDSLDPDRHDHDRSVDDEDAAAAIVRDILATSLRVPLGVVRQVRELLADPSQIPAATADAADTFRAIAAQLANTDPARSPLWTQRSTERRLDITSAPFAEVKAAATSLGGTMNHAFLTIAADAAARYHTELGAQVNELRASMAISTRTKESGANAFSLVRLLIPTSDIAIDERFHEIRTRAVESLHNDHHANIDTLATFAAALPTGILTQLARQQAHTVDLATSNVRGAPMELYVAGAQVLGNYAIGPLGGVACNVTLLSYRGRLDMGINTDPAAVSNASLLTRCFDDAVSGFVALAD
ncbi:MAG: wax ester/triacylglycerol synthase domain-containing protein [Ilumatobacter sp.]